MNVNVNVNVYVNENVNVNVNGNVNVNWNNFSSLTEEDHEEPDPPHGDADVRFSSEVLRPLVLAVMHIST